MALEKWTSYGVAQDGTRFAETTLYWDTKQKKFVNASGKLLIPREERDRRKAAIEPLVLYR